MSIRLEVNVDDLHGLDNLKDLHDQIEEMLLTRYRNDEGSPVTYLITGEFD